MRRRTHAIAVLELTKVALLATKGPSVDMRLAGANSFASLHFHDLLPGKSNY